MLLTPALLLALAAPAGDVLLLGVDDAGIPAAGPTAEARQVLGKLGRSVRALERAEAPDLGGLGGQRKAAQDLYIEGDLPGARAALRSILDALAEAGRLTPEHTALAQTLRLELAKWSFADDEAATREIFASVVRADPSFQLDEARYPPKMRAVFDAVRAEVLGQPTGAVEVRSTPEGARVFVDGRELGTTPVTLSQLPAGAHAVWVELDGLASGARPVRPEQASVVRFDLLADWARAPARRAPPSPLDRAALEGLAGSGAVLVLTHLVEGGTPWLAGAFVEGGEARLGAVEVIGGAADVERLVRGLLEGEPPEGPRPAWLLPPAARDEPTPEAGGGGWVWIATAVGVGVVVAAGATALGFALLPPAQGQFSVELVP